jgi:hypothetical protein
MNLMRLVAFLLVLCCSLPAQTNDSQTLHALLQEVRQLRDDMQGMTLVAQRVQILLYRIHLQDDVVKKAAVRHDQAKSKLKESEHNVTHTRSELKGFEEKLAGIQDRTQRTALEEAAHEFKRRAEMWAQEEVQWRASEAEAAGEARTEQLKLIEYQERLDKLEKQLEGVYNAKTK